MPLWKQLSSLGVAIYSASDGVSVVSRVSAVSREGKMGMKWKRARMNRNLQGPAGTHEDDLEATCHDGGVLQNSWCPYLWSYRWIWPRCPRS